MPRRSMKKTNKKIAKLLKEGLSYKEIAELAGTDRTQVSRVKYMVKNGLLRKKRVKKENASKVSGHSSDECKKVKLPVFTKCMVYIDQDGNIANGYFKPPSLLDKIKRFFGM